MPAPPKKFCAGSESFYGYEPSDVIKVGGPQGKRGPPGIVLKGDKGDKGDPGDDALADNETFDQNLALLYSLSKI